ARRGRSRRLPPASSPRGWPRRCRRDHRPWCRSGPARRVAARRESTSALGADPNGAGVPIMPPAAVTTLHGMTRPASRAIDELDGDIEHWAAPVLVRQSVDRIISTHPQSLERLQADPGFGRALIAVLGASNSLARLVEQHDDALIVLTELDSRPPLDPA